MCKSLTFIIAMLHPFFNNCQSYIWNTIAIDDTWFQLEIELNILFLPILFKAYTYNILKVKKRFIHHFIKQNHILTGQNWINMNFLKQRLWTGARGFIFCGPCFVKNDCFFTIHIPTEKL